MNRITYYKNHNAKLKRFLNDWEQKNVSFNITINHLIFAGMVQMEKYIDFNNEDIIEYIILCEKVSSNLYMQYSQLIKKK